MRIKPDRFIEQNKNVKNVKIIVMVRQKVKS